MEETTKEYKIDPEFFSYLPRPNEEEYARLEQQILTEGCLDPIRVWKGHDIVVDGMTRYSICQQHQKKFRVEFLEFADRAAVKLWMSRNQVSRRNLDSQQRDYHLGVIYLEAKRDSAGRPEKDTERGDTADAVADAHKVSRRKVLSSASFAKLLDEAAEKIPEVRSALNDGKKLSKTNLKKIAQAKSKKAAEKIVDEIITGEHSEEEAEEEKVPEEPEAPKVYDGMNNLILDPDFAGVFADRDEFVECLREMKALESRIKRLVGSLGGGYLNIVDFASLKSMKVELTERIPHCICIRCEGTRREAGKRDECSMCGGLGWIDKFRYDRWKAQKGKAK